MYLLRSTRIANLGVSTAFDWTQLLCNRPAVQVEQAAVAIQSTRIGTKSTNWPKLKVHPVQTAVQEPQPSKKCWLNDLCVWTNLLPRHSSSSSDRPAGRPTCQPAVVTAWWGVIFAVFSTWRGLDGRRSTNAEQFSEKCNFANIFVVSNFQTDQRKSVVWTSFKST